MRIDDLIVTPIAITDPPLLNAAGLHAPYALRVIVELQTDNGLYGLGEVPGGSAIAAALNAVKAVLVGQDPFHLNQIHQQIDAHLTRGQDARGEFPWDTGIAQHVHSAIEVACFDLMGKATDRPVVDLLGGRCRDRVPFSAYLFYKQPKARAACWNSASIQWRPVGQRRGSKRRSMRQGSSRRRRP